MEFKLCDNPWGNEEINAIHRVICILWDRKLKNMRKTLLKNLV